MKRLSLYRSGWPMALLWLAATTTTTAALAQPVYRSVGPDGRVVFSDKPMASAPGSTARGRPGNEGENPANRPDATTAPVATGTPNPRIALNGLPFELRQVASRYPVTLYTSTPCAPCDAGRTLLRQRGVPFIERQIKTNEDIEALAKLSGDAGIPFLSIGGKPVKGFSDGEWQGYLDAAGYPPVSQLPASYRGPDPTPLTPLKFTPSDTSSSGSGDNNNNNNNNNTATQPDAAPAPRRPRPALVPSPPSTPSPSNPAGIKF